MQLVACVTADMCVTADPCASGSIQAWSRTFMGIVQKIIFTAILLPSADLGICYLQAILYMTVEERCPIGLH